MYRSQKLLACKQPQSVQLFLEGPMGIVLTADGKCVTVFGTIEHSDIYE